MPMPHHVQKKLIQERIKDKFGNQRTKELKKALSELPNYSSGPYADLRNWVKQLIEGTKIRSKVRHRDWLGIKREGEAQIMLVGPPNIGKSSLIKHLTDKQIKIANYAFTTLKPIPSTLIYDGIEIQLVEIPGLIKGASEDRGGGKRLLGVIREADGLVLMCDLSRSVRELTEILFELTKSNIDKPLLIVGNKADLPGSKKNYEKLVREGYKVLPVSVKLNKNLDVLKEKLWDLTGLMRVYTENNELPLAIESGAMIKDLATKVHKDFLENFICAVVVGGSVKFDHQQVGLDHELFEGDRIKFVLRK
ncbi:GTP-binding protein [Candidatus Woesearchaeota archaeon]|nr:GTP-binding protein [Candidatus Woesearchaeota archaeon]